MPKLRAVLFDVFGTLLNVHSVATRAEQLFPGQGQALSQLWRARQLDYTRLRSLANQYVPFIQLTEDALQYAGEALSLPLDAAACGALMHEYSQLLAFNDVLPALKQLRQHDCTLGVLSNGDPGLLEDALQNAGLGDHFDLVLSADAVRAYKPAPSVYELGPRALQHPAAECLFVSANGWDACGAAWFGYQSFWVNRDNLPADRLGVQPKVGTSLIDAAREAGRFFTQQNQFPVTEDKRSR